MITTNSPLLYFFSIFPSNSKDLVTHGAGQLLQRYKHRHILLSTFFPEQEWLPWKFDKCPSNFWENVNNQRKFLDWAGKELKINEMSDWYNVSYRVNKYVLFFYGNQ